MPSIFIAVKCNEWACYYLRSGGYPSQADANCKKFGASLVSITSEKEYLFIKEFLLLQNTVPDMVTIG
jgi:hypothetical protein